MSAGEPPRVRRAPQMEALVVRLTEGSSAPFPFMKDLLVFAAAVGHDVGRREPFEGSGSPIRLEVFQRDPGSEFLMSALAVLEHPDQPEILGDDRVADRVAIFEEYANGGLETLQGELNVAHGRTDAEVVLDLLRRLAKDADDGEDDDLGLTDLAAVLDI